MPGSTPPRPACDPAPTPGAGRVFGLAHRLWRWLPATWRRRMLTRITAALAPRPDPVPPWAQGGVIIAGHLGSPTGLGEAARLMIRALRAMGVRVWTIDLADRTLRAAIDRLPAPPAAAPLILHVNPALLPLALLRLPAGLTRGRRLIAHWSWELPLAPPDWARVARLVHEVWVPSRFTARAIEPLKPHHVHVVPPVLALAPPVSSGLTGEAFGLPPRAIVVLLSFNLASSFARKNPLAAIAAFQAAFGTRADRVLAIKVCHTDHAPADFARLRQAAEAPNIRLITGELPPADRHALTACADIVLSLHRAEGFGLVPAEAMLLGKPVVATGWSGNLDFMDDLSAALVPYRLVPAEDPRSVYHGADWAEPDVAHAAEWLRCLADDPVLRSALGSRGQRAARLRLDGHELRAAIRALGLPVSQPAPPARASIQVEPRTTPSAAPAEVVPVAKPVS